MMDKKYLSVAGGLFLTAFLLVAVVFTAQMTSRPSNITRVAPRASSETGTVRALLVPATNRLISNGDTNVPVQIQLDPQGVSKTINSVQFRITYTSPSLQVVDLDTTVANIQIQSNLPTGWTLWQNVTTLDITTNTYTILFNAVNDVGYSFSSPTTFATILLNAVSLTSSDVTLTFNASLSKVFEKGTNLDILSQNLQNATLAVTTDAVTPVVTIGSGPATGSTINSRAPSFAWSATDDRALNVTPYAFALSGPTPTTKTVYSTTNTTTFNNLADGAYTFTAYGRDLAGNESSSARSFTVDATVPTVSISTGPAANSVTNANPVTFTFTGTDTRTSTANLVYSYSITGQAASAYGSATTASFSNLTDGSKTFSVTSRDEAGNISVAATRAFTFDGTAPTITLAASGPTGVINTNSGTFTWSGSDTRVGAVVTYAYRLDSGTWSSYSSTTSYTWSTITEGAHTFSVRGQDDVGNVSGIQTRTFTVDTTAPAVTLNGPTGTINTYTATFTWSGTDSRAGAIVTYSYRFNGGSWSAYSTTTTYTANSLTNGSTYTFDVRAQDDAGNVSTIQTRTFTVNTNALLPFKLKFDGVTTSNVANCPTRNVRVTLKATNGTTALMSPATVVTTFNSASGAYEGTLSNITLTGGTYDVYVKGPTHLASKYSTAISTTTSQQDWTTPAQKAGDVAGSQTDRTKPDNLIDIEDWQKIFGNMSGAQIIQTDPKANLDLNCDQIIDTTDIQRVFANVTTDYGPGGAE